MAEKYVASVKKALYALDVLAFEDARHEGVSLSHLSERTGVPANTLHAILKTMIRCGYVRQNSRSRYLTGMRYRQLGLLSRMRMNPQTSKVLDAALNRLYERGGEAVSFYMLDSGARINYTNITGPDIQEVDYSMLEDGSMYWYPSGRVLVAYSRERELLRIIRKNGWPGDLWDNATDFATLGRAAEAVRKAGYAKLISELNDSTSISVPVFYGDKTLLGALGVYLPTERANDEKCAVLLRLMNECAATVKAGLSSPDSEL